MQYAGGETTHGYAVLVRLFKGGLEDSGADAAPVEKEKLVGAVAAHSGRSGNIAKDTYTVGFMLYW